MHCKWRVRLNAYHDHELSESEAREIERHLDSCAACAAELLDIREIARSFDGIADDELSSPAMFRAHEAAEIAARELAATDTDSFVLRSAGLLTGLAASVLAIASIWLFESSSPQQEVSRPVQIVAIPAPAPEWERIAMTLEADPLTGSSTATPQGQTLAEARMTDWMLQNLNR